jgi:RNA polymerase sigma-70 factor, ECF subfamily
MVVNAAAPHAAIGIDPYGHLAGYADTYRIAYPSELTLNRLLSPSNVVPGEGTLVRGAPPEDRLMAQYAAGDEGAFQRLFALLAPRVRAFFVRSFADSTVADDLLQTTFLKLHCARSSYRPELPLKPWVFTIAASVRRDELRRRYRLPPHVGEAELEQAESGFVFDTLAVTTATARADAVRAAINCLPESQRVVLHLHCYEELTFEQIAGALGTTPGAVRVRASRAYERLREELRAFLVPPSEAP